MNIFHKAQQRTKWNSEKC